MSMRPFLASFVVVAVGLACSAAIAQTSGFQFRELNDKSLELTEGGKPVLVYNHGQVTSPKVPEKDTRRTRGCFVHPIYGLDGEVITDDFPKDHYHHVGLFWAWPHVLIDGKHYDLWTYKDIQQKFVRWIERSADEKKAVLAVENGWFIGDKQVMTERIRLTIHPAAQDSRSIDVQLTLIPGDTPVTLQGAAEKSYGGLTLRYAPPEASKTAKPEKPADKKAKATKPENKAPDTFITVPTGLTAADLPETRLAWADLVRKFEKAPDRSGAAIFVAKNHPDYPPMWLTRHYGVLCVGYPGVQSKTFESGKPVTLDYRVWIHRKQLDAKTIQAAYESYLKSILDHESTKTR